MIKTGAAYAKDISVGTTFSHLLSLRVPQDIEAREETTPSNVTSILALINTIQSQCRQTLNLRAEQGKRLSAILNLKAN